MSTKAPGFASVPALAQYLRYAAAAKLDTRTALAAAGIDEELLSDARERVTGEQFQLLLKNLIRQSEDPLFGLRSGAFVQPGSYSVLGYITMNCATLGEAIELIVPYEKIVGDMGVSNLEQSGDTFSMCWNCQYPDPQVRPHMIANVLMSWWNYARWLADRPINPSRVLLEFPVPEAQRAAFEQAFSAPVLDSRSRSGLLIDAALLELPLRQPDPQLRRTLEHHAQHQLRVLDESSTDIVQRTRNVISNQLREGLSRKDLVAAQMGMNARTLQRHLATANTSYQQLLDAVRLELAGEYLRQSNLSIHRIAQQLGFTDARSFHRSFKSRTGCTPGEFRQGKA